MVKLPSDSIDISIDYFLEILEENPKDAFLNYCLGLCYDVKTSESGGFIPESNLENTLKASHYYEKSITYSKSRPFLPKRQYDPVSKLSSIWGTMALAYLHKGQVDSAVWVLKKGESRGAFPKGLLDYNRNVLSSCEDGAILFTNGDNDTFPLFYIQLVEKFRADVKVINVSLLNADWYIKYMRDDVIPGVVTYSDTWIDSLGTVDAILERYTPGGSKIVELPDKNNKAMKWVVDATLHISYGEESSSAQKNNFFRIQDLVILHILENNGWGLPVYFATTVSNKNTLNLDDYLSMEGLVNKLYDEKVQEVNFEKMSQNLVSDYSFNIKKPGSKEYHFRKNISQFYRNYRTCYLQLGYHYFIEFSQEEEPEISSGIPKKRWAKKISELNNEEKALFYLSEMEKKIPLELVDISNPMILYTLAGAFFELGDEKNGKKYAFNILKTNPDSEVVKELFETYNVEYEKN